MSFIMSLETKGLSLPDYDHVVDSIAPLALHASVSSLHGTICGYLCAGAETQAEVYIRALAGTKKDKASRSAILVLFELFSVSEQQMKDFDFEFTMLLPYVEDPLRVRAQAFGEWCEGFVQGMNMAGIDAGQFDDEEAQDALQHLIEFAELDYESLEVGEDDEQALMEVYEYARMAVIRLHGDLVMSERARGDSGTTH
jgi:uncharacterized protein